MTGFGRSQSTPGGAAPPTEAESRHGGHPLHLPHLPHLHLPHLHLPQLHRPQLHRPRPGDPKEHPLLEALTHSLDLAGRGYCCAANPLEPAAAPDGDAGRVQSTTKGDATTKGGKDAKLSGK